PSGRPHHTGPNTLWGSGGRSAPGLPHKPRAHLNLRRPRDLRLAQPITPGKARPRGDQARVIGPQSQSGDELDTRLPLQLLPPDGGAQGAVDDLTPGRDMEPPGEIPEMVLVVQHRDVPA